MSGLHTPTRDPDTQITINNNRARWGVVKALRQTTNEHERAKLLQELHDIDEDNSRAISRMIKRWKAETYRDRRHA